jgi:hypothetical protein
MIPRSAAEGQEVNSRNADEVFKEDGLSVGVRYIDTLGKKK